MDNFDQKWRDRCQNGKLTCKMGIGSSQSGGHFAFADICKHQSYFAT